MFIVNRLDTSRLGIIAKALGLTAICIVAMVATVHIAPIVIATLAAIVATTLGIVAAAAVAITHAAIFAATMLLAVAVRVVIFAALALVLPVLWRSCCWLWAHRDGVFIAARGLALGAVVVGVFVAACVWGPVLVAALPSVATVAGVFGGFIAAAGKVM